VFGGEGKDHDHAHDREAICVADRARADGLDRYRGGEATARRRPIGVDEDGATLLMQTFVVDGLGLSWKVPIHLSFNRLRR
jgi:hypothetical protein